MSGAVSLDRRSSLALSVDIDPGWYEGQPETADANEAEAAATALAHAASAPAAVTPTASAPADADAAAAATPPSSAPTAAGGSLIPTASGSHVPTVLTKLQKWGDYESFGEPVWPTKLIPMKTPLSADILDNWQLPEAPKHRLTVSTLLEAEAAAGRRVGLLMDLSNHDCLYEADIPADVHYLHVQLVAKELPPLEFVREVGRAVNQFWATHPDEYIAIHCAYGFNRTGFVVASYLVENCGLTVDQALASFAAARPPGVKHEKFRQELWARYGSSTFGHSGSSSNSSSTQPLPVPLQRQQGMPGGNGSSSSSATQLQQSSPPVFVVAGGAAAGAAAAAGNDGSFSRLSCRSCGSNSSSTATRWPAGSSPGGCSEQVGTAGGSQASGAGPPEVLLVQAAQGSSPPCTTQAAAAAQVTQAAAGAAAVPRCCCCDAELTEQDIAAAAALQRSSSSSSSSRLLDGSNPNPGRSGSASSMGRSTSLVYQQQQYQPQLPPVLTPDSSRMLLSSSPGGMMRLPGRCWSSNSVGDNSSIGCSPTSSNADLVNLRLSGCNSSGLDSSSTPAAAAGALQRGAIDPTAAAEADGEVAERLLLSQVWLTGMPPFQRSNNSSSGGGCAGQQQGSADDQEEAGAAADADARESAVPDGGCFEMDYPEPGLQSPPGQQCYQQQQQGQQQQQDQQQQQEQQALSSLLAAGLQEQQQQGHSRRLSAGRRKSVTFSDVLCCEQAAPNCSSMQQLRGAELDSLLANVGISQQQQQQQPQPMQQLELQRHSQQQQQGVLQQQSSCSCSCHDPQAAATGQSQGQYNQQQHNSSRGSSQTLGQDPDSTSSSGGDCGSRRLYGRRSSSSNAAAYGGSPTAAGTRPRPGDEEGAVDPLVDPLENESFGKITSEDLLASLRNLRRSHGAS